MLGMPDTRQAMKLAERAIDALERIATALEARGPEKPTTLAERVESRGETSRRG